MSRNLYENEVLPKIVLKPDFNVCFRIFAFALASEDIGNSMESLRKGKVSTVDLLVLTSPDQLLFYKNQSK
jgi:hypothetical protein